MPDGEVIQILIQTAVYVCAVLVGFVAGFVNTLAGNGSVITLPMLMVLGLSAHEANATNRVGVVLSSFTGTATFRRAGALETKHLGWILVPSVLGGLAGAQLPDHLDKRAMEIVLAGAMVVMLILVVAKPNRWIKGGTAEPNVRRFRTVLLLFAVSAYGGFIQAGVGVLLLATLVLGCGYGLARANPLKVAIVFMLTVPALAVYCWAGQVDLAYGLLMASGQVTGAWLAARFATRHPQANVWVRRLLIVVIPLAIVKILFLNDLVLTAG